MRTALIVAAIFVACTFALDAVTENYEDGVSGAAAVLAANRVKIEKEQQQTIDSINAAFKNDIQNAKTAEEKKILVEKRLSEIQAVLDNRDVKVANANDVFRSAHQALKENYKEEKAEVKVETKVESEAAVEAAAEVAAETATGAKTATGAVAIEDRATKKYFGGINGAALGLKAERAKLESAFSAKEKKIQDDFEAAIVNAKTAEEKKTLVEARLAAEQNARDARNADVQAANDAFRSAHAVLRDMFHQNGGK